MCIVYVHRNKLNDKCYVGITKMEPNIRWGTNGSGYRGSLFGQAIEEYGWNNFEHLILFNNLTVEEAHEKEAELIIKYDSYYNGYNNSLGIRITERKEKALQGAKRKISKIEQKRIREEKLKISLEQRKKEFEQYKRRKKSDEAKRKISEANKVHWAERKKAVLNTIN